jgi:hypothetical protein
MMQEKLPLLLEEIEQQQQQNIALQQKEIEKHQLLLELMLLEKKDSEIDLSTLEKIVLQQKDQLQQQLMRQKAMLVNILQVLSPAIKSN